MQALFHSWQVLLGLGVCSYSVAALFQKTLMKDQKTDGVTFSIAFQLFVGIIVGFFALLHGFKMPNFLPYIPNLGIMILFYGFGNVCIFKALNTIDLSEFTVLLTTRALWTIFTSVIFLGEKFLPLQILGTALIILSITFISFKQNKFTFNKGALFTLLAGFLFGIAFTNDAFFLQRFDELSYVSIAFILPSIGMLFFYPKTFVKVKEILLPGAFWKLSAFSALYALAAVTIFGAYQVGRNAAQIAVIDQSATILTVILAVIFLHETKDILKKLLATVVAFVGVILVG